MLPDRVVAACPGGLDSDYDNGRVVAEPTPFRLGFPKARHDHDGPTELTHLSTAILPNAMNQPERTSTDHVSANRSGEPTAANLPAANSDRQPGRPDRRDFLKRGTAASAGLASAVAAIPAVHAAEEAKGEDQLVKIGIVGAGGRGGGALGNTLSINENIKLLAIADLNTEKLPRLRDSLAARHEGKVDVPDERMYGGIDGYKRVLDDDEIDVVLFATPPGFRPMYVRDAVDAGKHVFAEKPTCVDPAGYRICMQADAKARENGTAIVTGTQYRRQTNYMEVVNRIHEGEIGDVIGATTRYCSTGIWYRGRREGMSDTEYQIFNWMHFIWLSGDQIAEQAIHNIDVMNWVMGGPPLNAFGGGGRFTRPDDSEMWDNMAIDYEYPGNRFVSFMCRQIPNTQSENGSVVYGSKGQATILGGNSGASIADRDGNEVWSMKGDIGAAYQQEHKDLVDSIRAGKPIVEFAQTSKSSLTAVMGRLAAYSGKRVSWDFVTEESELDLFPEDFDIDGSLESPGYAVPGKYDLV